MNWWNSIICKEGEAYPTIDPVYDSNNYSEEECICDAQIEAELSAFYNRPRESKEPTVAPKEPEPQAQVNNDWGY